MWQKPIQNTNWRLAMEKRLHTVIWPRNLVQTFWGLHSAFHRSLFLPLLSWQPASKQQWLERNTPEANLFSVPPIPTKTSLRPQKITESQSDLSVSEQRPLTFEQRFLSQTQTNHSQSLQFTTYLSRVSWGTLLPPALLLTLAFLLAVISAL